jgi:glyoxylase-like metal-dependent hydrolase (beta-lactamase superfamily II)
MRLGDFRLDIVSDGAFRLDGGAMFGVVPRTLWEKQKVPDDKNRIRMATNCLLVRTGREVVLVDAGIGDKNDAKFRAIYGMEEGARRLPDSLAAVGVALEDVTHVVLSHLHFDHCGWSTRLVDGVAQPTFPRARYFMNRAEAEHAKAPNERDRASYDPRNWDVLFEREVVTLFDRQAEIVPGVRAVEAPGHNGSMCVVTVESGGETAVFWADLVPTAAHLPYPWVMGYDLYPVTTMENKQVWLPRAAEGDWLCVFEHDAETPVARLRPAGRGRYQAEAVSLAGDERT